jgi:hypothetical protein
LMAAQQQTATLSAYINKKLGVFYSSSHLEPEDQTSRYEVGAAWARMISTRSKICTLA